MTHCLAGYLLAISLLVPSIGFTQATTPPSEIDRIFADDQQARQPPDPKAPKTLFQSDEERQATTAKLLVTDKLQSGKDFFEAAVIFQHSHNADDYLIAHTLSLIALSLGYPDAMWIATATLDRYLMAIGKRQIYGTQFMTPQGKHATQEPFNRSLISDALRKKLGVQTLAEQEVTRKEFDSE